MLSSTFFNLSLNFAIRRLNNKAYEDYLLVDLQEHKSSGLWGE